MRLVSPAGRSARPSLSTAITPPNSARRRVRTRLSHYNAFYYDVQQLDFRSTPLTPAEATQHLDHLVRGEQGTWGRGSSWHARTPRLGRLQHKYHRGVCLQELLVPLALCILPPSVHCL